MMAWNLHFCWIWSIHVPTYWNLVYLTWRHIQNVYNTVNANSSLCKKFFITFKSRQTGGNFKNWPNPIHQKNLFPSSSIKFKIYKDFFLTTNTAILNDFIHIEFKKRHSHSLAYAQPINIFIHTEF